MNKMLAAILFLFIMGTSAFTASDDARASNHTINFPSQTTNTDTGTGPTWNSGSRDACPDGQYMSGVNRAEWNGGTSQGLQIVCSPAPSGYSFPSATANTDTGTGPTWNSGSRDACPDGQYMSGVNRAEYNGGTSQGWQIVCSPAPTTGFTSNSPTGISFPSSSDNINFGSGPTDNSWSRDVCQDGYYMSGLNRGEWNGGTSQGFQIVCSPAPSIAAAPSPPPPCGNAGEACCGQGSACTSGLSCVSNICIATGGTGQQCNSNNTCSTGYCCTAEAPPMCYPAPAASFITTPSATPPAIPAVTAPGVVGVDASASGTGTYAWDWGDGIQVPASASQTATHTFGNATANPITRTIALTYTDECGRRSTATRQVTINPNPAPPTASFTVDPLTGPAPLLVRVDGSASADADADWGGRIDRFQWSWGDDTADSFGVRSSHTYDALGTYTITLTVTDRGGFQASMTQTVAVTDMCTPACSGATPVCGPSETVADATQCYQCRSDAQCGTGYQCLGTNCAQGARCPDGSACPLDGRCAEAVACAPGSLCADGSACLEDTGICAPLKNLCSLTADYVPAQCYVETRKPQAGACTNSTECTDGLNGGQCVGGECRYARCLYDRGSQQACKKDKDCANGDGVCSNGTCNYIYDCAYGPGLGKGLPGLYTATSTDEAPDMPRGVRPNGEACTQPTPDAPNNCEGINGCLYYNYNRLTGSPLSGTAQNPVGNSVANCVNEVEGGTGCVYYGDYRGSDDTNRANDKVNCLPRAANRTDRDRHRAYAGLPAGCEVVDKGNGIKDYNCTAVKGDFCYYYADGRADCDYAVDTDDPAKRGTGCIYEPNPERTIQCPRQFKAPTAGTSFVQCLLNPDALLPGFVLGTGGAGLQSCRVDANCPAGNICLDGTCFAECQGGQDCATGQVCCPPGSTINPTTGLCEDSGGGLSCSDTTKAHSLPDGTPDAAISVSTNQPATCKFSLWNEPFADMTGQFAPGGTTDHAGTVSGLLNAQNNTVYVRCQPPGGGAETQCPIQIAVGACTDDAQCVSGMCNPETGFCEEPPECANASPTGALPYGTLTTGTTIRIDSVDKDGNPVDATCVYSRVSANVYACNANVQSCSSVTVFSATGGTTHTSDLSGQACASNAQCASGVCSSGWCTGNSLLTLYNNTRYVRCQESASGDVLPVCQIPFSIALCGKDYQCTAAGSQCINGRCEPPLCSNSFPSGERPLGTSEVDLRLDSVDKDGTPVNAVCKYSKEYKSSFFSTLFPMMLFDVTEGLSHTAYNVPAVPGPNRQYVECQEAVLKEIGECRIDFNVGKSCAEDEQCDLGWSCDPQYGICVPPPCDGRFPAGQQDTGSFVAMGLTTAPEPSACRYANVSLAFDNMLNQFSSSDGLSHTTAPATVEVQEGLNSYLVRCRGTELPNKEKSCTISFNGGPCDPAKPGQCEFGYQCNVFTKTCEDCTTNPSLPGCDFQDFCELNPGSPLCRGNTPPRIFEPGELSCNTLGYTFTGSAVMPTGNCDLVAIILAILSWIAWLVALLAVLSGLRAAYLYITSMGDEKRLREARAYLVYTTIGVGVAVLSFSIVAITRAILNI